jgi:hypothetical protein
MAESPRAKFIRTVDHKRLAGYAWDAMKLASHHDPDLVERIDIIERQLERLGAPQYRVLRKGKRASK